MTILLAALDPDLVIYDPEDFDREDWRQDTKHSALRLAALSLHRQMIKYYNLKIAITDQFWNSVSEHFPWNTRDYAKTHDFRMFMFEELAKRQYKLEPANCQSISLNPAQIVCCYIDCENVVRTWEQLLVGFTENVDQSQFNLNIATWEKAIFISNLKPDVIKLEYCIEGEDNKEYAFSVIYDDNSWYKRLAAHDWWPNLELMVGLHYKTNNAIQSYDGVREYPMKLVYDHTFTGSVYQYYCNVQIREPLIEALTKVVYGVHDAGLGLEKIGKHAYRFRVTDFWRVHCFIKQDQVTLNKFGQHRIDGVG